MTRIPLIYAAGFRRWLKFTPTQAELSLVNTLEAQRQRLGRVRAYVADPNGRFTRIVLAYIEWVHVALSPDTEAVLCVPSVAKGKALTAGFRSTFHFVTPRSPYRGHGIPRPVHRHVIFNADKLCPSRPYHLSVLDTLNAHAVGSLPLRQNSVFIMLGDPFRRRRNRFRHYWLRARESTAILTLAPSHLLPASLPTKRTTTITISILLRTLKTLKNLKNLKTLTPPTKLPLQLAVSA